VIAVFETQKKLVFKDISIFKEKEVLVSEKSFCVMMEEAGTSAILFASSNYKLLPDYGLVPTEFRIFHSILTTMAKKTRI
jgi:hypothetical protein